MHSLETLEKLNSGKVEIKREIKINLPKNPKQEKPVDKK